MVAAAAVAALAMASTACGSDEPAPAQADPKPEATTAGPKDLSGLLANPHDDPSQDEVMDADFTQVAAKGLLGVPKGMTFAPDTCVNYVRLGDAAGTPLQTAPAEQMGKLNGWMQFNAASPVGKDHNLGHDNFFAHYVVELSGLDVKKMGDEAISTCSDGTVTLDGKLTGELVNTTLDAPVVPGATATFAIKQRLQFAPAKTPADGEILKKYYGKLDPNGGMMRQKYITMVAFGDVLYFGIVGEPQYVTKMADNFGKRASQKGLA
ncbi:hypothetical protein [Phytohabitans flavus]|nr:hypothetical protein [Phytohabitans flavus]